MKEKIIKIFNEFSVEEVKTIVELPASASPRKYFRIITNDSHFVATFGNNLEENEAFFYLTKQLSKNSKINSPEIFFVDKSRHFYIQSDLGDLDLANYLKNKENFSNKILYDVISNLYSFQTERVKEIDSSKFYPSSNFNFQSIMWDLNYFKYYFVKLHEIDFNEKRLESDFVNLTKYILQAKSDFLMYRDFQSRNIMIKDEKPYFIDYQGARLGPLQYDVASLLYDSVADFNDETREEFLNYYLTFIKKDGIVSEDEFLKYYYYFVLIRLFQALGAFGFRGLIQKKKGFAESIPKTVKNIETVLKNKIKEFPFTELGLTLNKLFREILK